MVSNEELGRAISALHPTASALYAVIEQMAVVDPEHLDKRMSGIRSWVSVAHNAVCEAINQAYLLQREREA